MTDQYHDPWGQPSSNDPQSSGPESAPPASGPPAFASPQAGYGTPQPEYSQIPDSFGSLPPAQPYAYADPQLAGMAPGAPMASPIRADYAPWIKRVGAYLIDHALSAIGALFFYYGYIFFILDFSRTQQLSGSRGLTPMIIGMVIILLGTGFTIYNRYLVGGRTGQSLGKRVTHLRLIDEATGQPIGPLNAFLRDLVHILDGLAYVGYLWPLWDEKKQTFADKLMKSIVVDTVREEWPGNTRAESQLPDRI